MMDATLEKILQSPRLGQYAQRIQDVLQAEKDKRAWFYEEIATDQKAEFINGEIFVHSPVQFRHSKVAKLILVLLDAHVRLHKLGYVGYEKVMVSLTRNDYEPDICFFRAETAGQFTPGQMHFPAPDFIVEVISPSTEANDRGIKLEDYAAHGVAEYWIVDPNKETIEQYVLRDETYELRLKQSTGVIESVAVQDFTFPVRAAFDEHENMQALQSLLV